MEGSASPGTPNQKPLRPGWTVRILVVLIVIWLSILITQFAFRATAMNVLMNDDSDQLERLLDYGGLSPNDVPFRMTDRLATYAIGHPKCLRVLIKHHVDLNYRDSRGWTPLMSAAAGSSDDVRMMLDGGADPRVSVRGESAADIAARFGNADAARMIRDYQR